MKLILGTAQFGLAYGVAGRSSPVPNEEIRDILALAWEGGVRMLDTASAYGDIEARLPILCGALPFGIVSKIPSVPTELDAIEAAAWAVCEARRSLERLGDRLSALLVHDAGDLSSARGRAIWEEIAEWGAKNGPAVGASTYGPDSCKILHETLGVGLCQVPCNALDQRVLVAIPSSTPGLELHLRSVFLQGLLLMPIDQAVAAVPAASGPIAAWHEWCGERGLDEVQAALSIVKSVSAASSVVVGVDSRDHVLKLLSAWSNSVASPAPELATTNCNIVDPRRWGSK